MKEIEEFTKAVDEFCKGGPGSGQKGHRTQKITTRQLRRKLFDVKEQDKTMVVLSSSKGKKKMTVREARQELFKEKNQDSPSKYSIQIVR